MSVSNELVDAGVRAVPFLGIMILWIVITLVVYGGFVLLWPEIPGAEPWIFLGVYLFPFVGFAGHVLQQALGRN